MLDLIGASLQKIPLKAAARILKVPERNLREREAEGLITVERRETGRARALVDLKQLRREVAALRCRAPGCKKRARRAGRFCSPGCSVRKYARETRVCKQCKEEFEVEGHRIRDRGEEGQPGEGQQFCSPKCVADWRWANERESFPQSEKAGREWRCPDCGETYYRPLSHLHVKRCRKCASRHLLQTDADAEKRFRDGKRKSWEDEKQALTVPLCSDVARELGVSVPTVTAYYVEQGLLVPGSNPPARLQLTAEPALIGGVRVLTCPNAQAEVRELLLARAKGPAYGRFDDADAEIEREHRRTGAPVSIERANEIRKRTDHVHRLLAARQSDGRPPTMGDRDAGWLACYENLRESRRTMLATGDNENPERREEWLEVQSDRAIFRTIARAELGPHASRPDVEQLAKRISAAVSRSLAAAA